MKKLFFIFSLMLVSFNAFAGDLQPVGDYLPLNYVDPYTNPQDGHGRGPVYIPTVTIDGYTLYLWDAADFTISIVDDEEQVVYTTFVPADQTSVALPTTLSGSYTIEVIRGSQTFVGVIEF
jgi:hypothetical protein